MWGSPERTQSPRDGRGSVRSWETGWAHSPLSGLEHAGGRSVLFHSSSSTCSLKIHSPSSTPYHAVELSWYRWQMQESILTEACALRIPVVIHSLNVAPGLQGILWELKRWEVVFRILTFSGSSSKEDYLETKEGLINLLNSTWILDIKQQISSLSLNTHTFFLGTELC